ncbi:MAG: hypothetical protein OHK0029_08320 [Armatimonadaceae bacterium]
MRERRTTGRATTVTCAHLYTHEGKAREVAVLASAHARVEETGYDQWDGGTQIYTIYLEIPILLYSQIAGDKDSVKEALKQKLEPLLHAFPRTWLDRVVVLPLLQSEDGWREKAIAWLAGDGVTNQGRVRSANVAPLSCDGLLFRSEPEIYLYRALKAVGISFAPLPVFLRGGESYRRIEPDFVLFKDGVMLLVEVDGDTVHTESPAEAHARTTMLLHEGAYVERVKASECGTLDEATRTAHRLIEVIRKYRSNR